MISLSLFDQHLDLDLLKKSFLGLTAAILLILPLDLLSLSFSAGKKTPLAVLPALQKTVVEPRDHYESAFQAGGIFGSPAASSGLAVLKSSIPERVKDYRLKGVVFMQEPEAIFEDARTQKSLFVKAGDKLGELTVKEVHEDKVVLTYYGEETVLQIE